MAITPLMAILADLVKNRFILEKIPWIRSAKNLIWFSGTQLVAKTHLVATSARKTAFK